MLTQLPDLDVFVATGNLSGGARITNNIVLCFSLHRFEVNTKLGLQGHPFTMQADKAWYCKLFLLCLLLQYVYRKYYTELYVYSCIINIITRELKLIFVGVC